MSVKLRLSRMGRKKRPYYRIVAVDSRRKRDGAFIERLGYYHPLDNPATVQIEGDKALHWLRDGAIPSATVLSLLKREGVWLRFRLEKRGLPESQINQMMNEWFTAHHKAAPAAETAATSPPACGGDQGGVSLSSASQAASLLVPPASGEGAEAGPAPETIAATPESSVPEEPAASAGESIEP